ncbi:unnamed protein product [Pararhodospirillum photometricum DSM 122]|uniref:Uncharacterized protein n=1 Tax=Pararhodospirillum photometricum DSM 122 TaxID=1150469 RepID=H6SM74_PARPM|nr:unnamed protein product [Pararhodospirillum photometricum DSM 122]
MMNLMIFWPNYLIRIKSAVNNFYDSCKRITSRLRFHIAYPFAADPAGKG